MRIAIAGFQHETNTFAPLRADWNAFVRKSVWPGLTRGDAIRSAFAGFNLPIAGFMQAAEAAGHELCPIVWCSAEPCSYVTDDAFDRVMAILRDGLAAARSIDAVYLDLHGAMVTESHEDGEGATLAVVREIVGDALPVVISLDLHVNLTPQMVERSDAIAIYRTYPHLDMAATGARCVPLLERMVSDGKPGKAFRQMPFLTPLQAQYTEHAPNKRLYESLPGESRGAVWSADIASGFPPADIHHSGPALVAYADTQAAADATADRLFGQFVEAESEFETATLSAADAVQRALRQPAGKPVVLADIQDNPGAGGTSDTTGLLQALIAGGARGAYMALLQDSEVAAMAHASGVGKSFAAPLGGKLGGPGDGSYSGRFEVIRLSDGVFPFSGEMCGGATAALGPTAWLRVLAPDCEVHVVVGSQRCQCLDQAIFRHIGIDLDAARIVAVKSTVHFRADFEPIAQAVWPVVAAGSHPCDLTKVDYRRLRPGVRLGPGGPDYVAPNA